LVINTPLALRDFGNYAISVKVWEKFVNQRRHACVKPRDAVDRVRVSLLLEGDARISRVAIEFLQHRPTELRHFFT